MGIRARVGDMRRIEEKESLCELHFRADGPYWHIWTSENHQIIFTSQSDFMAAMMIMGIAARLCPYVRIITFEWMSNHMHIVAAGEEEDVITFIKTLKRLLTLHLKGSDRSVSDLEFSSRMSTSLTELRNVIAYVNRNGYLVSPNESPYSYPWGANRYYFNPDAKTVYVSCCERTTVRELRNCINSHLADKIEPFKKVHGYVCPMDFCQIDEGEQLFANASQYFYAVSRSVESYKAIAKELSESIFLTDEEMFSAACSIASNKYQTKLSGLDNNARLEVARIMHFDYNASNKQIIRILKLPATVVNTMFPE